MRLLLLLVVSTAVWSAPARAQMGFFPFVGYDFESEDVHVGAGLQLGGLITRPVQLALQPSVEVSLGNQSDVSVDLDAVAQLGQAPVAPYAGAGLGLVFPDADGGGAETELGLNAFGGVQFTTVGFAQPFVEGRYSTAGEDAFSVQAGALFSF